MDYCTAFKIRLETAEDKAGYYINEVAKTHMFLKGAGLAPRFKDDVMLKVNNDRERFDEIVAIVAKVAKQHQSRPEEAGKHLLYGAMYDDDQWDDIPWFEEAQE